MTRKELMLFAIGNTIGLLIAMTILISFTCGSGFVGSTVLGIIITLVGTIIGGLISVGILALIELINGMED